MGMQDDDTRGLLGRFVTLGLHAGPVSDQSLTQRAIVVYAVYMTTNKLRNSRAAAVDIGDVLQQFAKEATRGHRWATTTLDGYVRQDAATQTQADSTRRDQPALMDDVADAS